MYDTPGAMDRQVEAHRRNAPACTIRNGEERLKVRACVWQGSATLRLCSQVPGRPTVQ